MPGNLLAQAPVADWPEAEGANQRCCSHLPDTYRHIDISKCCAKLFCWVLCSVGEGKLAEAPDEEHFSELLRVVLALAGPRRRDFHRWYHGMRYLDATPVIL